ncbi:ornithine carbamoyltransferase [Candidatus Heimdallarchaeota archaeon]|nr:MAG: ornithine carbamoyltransferase [Candidatus Heimdallarchaeota archaeon]
MDLKGRSLLSLKDYTTEEIRFLLDESKKLKAKFKAFERDELPLEGMTLGMIFQKRSTRTRVSTEVAMYYLGGHALFLSSADIQLGGGETIKDTSRVLSRMVDGVLARVYSHNDVEELVKYSTVPIINALSDKYHPLQILADLLTIEEHKGKLEGLKLAWVGDGNNVCNSLLIGCAKMGMDMSVATPKGYEVPADVVALAKEFAEETGSKIITTNDAVAAVTDADIVVTDTFISMGEEDQEKAKLAAFKDYVVTEELCDNAKTDYIFLHCLPYKHKEATEEVFESEHSVVFDEAENRLHTVMAVLKNLMG